MSGSRPVVVVGRVLDEPKLKRTSPGGIPFLKLKLAVTRNSKRERTAIVVEATIRGRLAEICGSSLRKGQTVAVAGSLKAHRSKGASRARLEVVADRVQILEPAR